MPKRRSSDGENLSAPFLSSIQFADYFDRELNKVYTNGTLVDPEFLTDEQAGHCVSVFEEPGADDEPDKNKNKGRIVAKGEDKGHRFGVCVLDCATSQFNLSAFEDDVCRTKLETLMRQIRPKEVLFKKVFEFFLSRGVLSDYVLLGYIVGNYAKASQDGSS